jgi:hypothetical protein
MSPTSMGGLPAIWDTYDQNPGGSRTTKPRHLPRLGSPLMRSSGRGPLSVRSSSGHRLDLNWVWVSGSRAIRSLARRAWAYLRGMDRTSGRLMFKIGEAFPAADPVATFVATLGNAWSDLLFVNKRLVGGGDERPFQHDVPPSEEFCLLRASISHLRELRDMIGKARDEEPAVEAFVDGLPDSVRDDLDQLMNLNTDKHDWIEQAIDYIRHKTAHYDRGATRWALERVADEEGAVVVNGPLIADVQLEFADRAMLQHFVRIPDGHDVDEDESVFVALAQALARGTGAAIRFANSTLDAYFDTLPQAILRIET